MSSFNNWDEITKLHPSNNKISDPFVYFKWSYLGENPGVTPSTILKKYHTPHSLIKVKESPVIYVSPNDQLNNYPGYIHINGCDTNHSDTSNINFFSFRLGYFDTLRTMMYTCCHNSMVLTEVWFNPSLITEELYAEAQDVLAHLNEINPEFKPNYELFWGTLISTYNAFSRSIWVPVTEENNNG